MRDMRVSLSTFCFWRTMVDVKGGFRESAKYKSASEGSECWHGLTLTLTTGENLSDLLWIVYHQGTHADLFFFPSLPLWRYHYSRHNPYYILNDRGVQPSGRGRISISENPPSFHPLSLLISTMFIYIFSPNIS